MTTPLPSVGPGVRFGGLHNHPQVLDGLSVLSDPRTAVTVHPE